MWHYIIAVLFSTVLYFQWGKEIALGFFLSFLAYKIYKAIKFLGKGKSEMILGEDGKIIKWNFKGALFSFSADLDTMTARFICPSAKTTIHDIYDTNNKFINGPLDIEIPLQAIKFISYNETSTKDTSYSATDLGYRIDGSFGQVYVPKIVTTSGENGRIKLWFLTYKGSPKGSFEAGKENLAWTRDTLESDKSYGPQSSLSGRQARSFLEDWILVEAAINERISTK